MEKIYISEDRNAEIEKHSARKSHSKPSSSLTLPLLFKKEKKVDLVTANNNKKIINRFKYYFMPHIIQMRREIERERERKCARKWCI